MPDWAAFFLGLGSSVAGVGEGPTRVVVAITTPTRAFAAALCAAGVMIERTRTEVSADPAAHFAYLRTLPLGTTVTYRPGPTGAKQSTGTLYGFVTEDGNDYVVIQVPSGGFHKFLARMATRVEPVSNASKRPPSRMRFTRVNLNAGLMAGLLSADQAATFVGNSRLDCAVIGNRRLLGEEMTDAPFAITTAGGERIEGRLQDVARARAFLRDGECYRSDVVSVASRVRPARLVSSPAVVIFDGSRSFVKWSRSYPSANWIVVLDRADRRLEEASEMVDALYATRIGDGASLTVKSAPIGIECAVFEARRGAA